MSTEDSEVTVMFADIVGSTSLYEIVGDEAAEALVSSTLKQLSEIIIDTRGVVVKTIGDEVLSYFVEAEDAITAARKMHEYLAEKTAPSREYKVAIRVGAHHGTAIESEGDIYGDTVNLAARVAALARGGKTMITGYTQEQLSGASRKRCQHFTRTTVKGKEHPIDIFDVVWEQTDELTRLVGRDNVNAIRNILTLEYDDNIIKMSETTKTATTVGRSMDCDLLIPSPQASREHCRIECNRGKFVLSDNSANGCYVSHNGTELFFHQERVPLLGEGLISLGEPVKDNSDYLLKYSIALPESNQPGPD